MKATRSRSARFGIVLLNLFGPGLGLIRLGNLRDGLAFWFAPWAALLLITFWFAISPTIGPRGFAALAVVLLLVVLVLYIGAMALSWKRSRRKDDEKPWWARWYALIALVLLSIMASEPLVSLPHSYYKPFYIPSESMRPTLEMGDKFVVDMREASMPSRGELVVFQFRDAERIARVAALPGDRIAFRDGVPIINGHPVEQRLLGTTMIIDSGEPRRARTLIEKLPGEKRSHQIFDLGTTRFDDAAEVVVPRGQIFVLGDNRDRSADSRFPVAEFGVGLVSLEDIQGTPLFIHWSRDRAEIGKRIAY